MFSSPFESFLRTNYAPDATEFEQILNLLKEPQERLARLSDQIERLETQLMALKIERDSLLEYIHDHRALLSPFRHLPDDIIREIFVHCLEEYPIRSTKHAPLLLTTVCRLWRRIALETPRLWSSIHIYVPYYSRPHGQILPEDLVLAGERQSGIERWLDRSGSVPVAFSLSFPGTAPYVTGTHGEVILPDDQADVCCSILNTFLRYRARWRVARIAAVHPQLLVSMQTWKPEEFPKLECLIVDIYQGLRDQPSAIHLQSLDPVLRAPSLRRLNLDLGSLSFNVLGLPGNWNHITDLSLRQVSNWDQESWSPLDMLKILTRVARTIRSFSFSPAIIPDPIEEYSRVLSVPTLMLPALEVFTVILRKNGVTPGFSHPSSRDLTDFETISRLFDLLSCPALVNLTVLGFSMYSSITTTSSLLHFLSQSGCNLKTFCTDIRIPKNAFECILRLMPSLTTFVYHNAVTPYASVGGPKDLFEILELTTASSSRDPVCSCLRHVVFTGFSKDDAEYLLRFARSRLRFGTFKSLKVHFNEQTDEIYRAQIASLREKGVDVKWVYQPEQKYSRPTDSPDEGLCGHDYTLYSWLFNTSTVPSLQIFEYRGGGPSEF